MKGLLVKDLILIKNRGKLLLIFFILSLIGIIGNTNFALILTMCISYFAVTTISYDDFEHGFPYLFSLPATRMQYVTEKFILSLILNCLSWVAYLLMHSLRLVLHGQKLHGSGTFFLMPMGFVLTLMILGISIAIQLKFGTEKGRYVTWLVWAVLGGAIVITAHFIESRESLLIVFGLVPLLLYGCSYWFSCHLIKKKEF